MIAELPTGRRGQALAATLTVTVLAALWAGVVAPLADWYNDRAEQVAGQQTVLGRMQALAAALHQGALAVPQGGSQGVIGLAGDSDALAGATLLGSVQAMAATAGASLTSSGALPPAPAGASRRIGVRVTMSAPWPVLVHLLLAIEQATPKLLVDDLQLHADPASSSGSDDHLIGATFSVHGFRAATPPAKS